MQNIKFKFRYIAKDSYQILTALACRLKLVSKHGVESKKEEADVTGDHGDGRHDKGKDELVVKS